MGRLEGEERAVAASGHGQARDRPPRSSTGAVRDSLPASAGQVVTGLRSSAAGQVGSDGGAVRQTALLAAQRTAGNAAVSRMLRAERSEPAPRPEPASLRAIHEGSRHLSGATFAAAGVPVAAPSPDGASQVASHGSGGTLAGYTGIKGANAFTAPSFRTRPSAEVDGIERRHYAEIEPTSTTDATHECYYLAAGDHHSLLPRDYWRVSPEVSRLLRAGEQEHLDDARLAFDLTYGLIARRINALSGQKFGPANTPAEAEALAEAQVRRRLPDQLGMHPLTWFNALNEMLRMSRHRDYRGWHEVAPSGTPSDDTEDTYRPLRPTSQTRIGEVPSEEVVTYPSGD